MTNETQIEDLKVEIAQIKAEVRQRLDLNEKLEGQISLNIQINKIDSKKLALTEQTLELLTALNK